MVIVVVVKCGEAAETIVDIVWRSRSCPLGSELWTSKLSDMLNKICNA